MDPEKRDIALRRIPGPVAVVGVRRGEQMGGLTAAWVTRVSIEPPLLLVSIGHERHTFAMLEGASQFSVSVLAEDQVDTARLFGLKSRRDVDKWARVDHDLLGDGIPVLQGCAARFLCRITDSFRTGDHDCFVGEVIEAEQWTERPALPMRGADYVPRDD